MLLNILVPLLALALDQLVKIWAYNSLRPVGTMPIIEGVFHLTYHENTGAAFSMFLGQRWLLLVLTVAILAGLIWALHKNWVRTTFGRVSLLLMIGGALGNILDRLFRGFVVDLFDFRLIHFPIFNVADILLNVGVGMMFIYILFIEPKLEKQEKGDKDGNDPSAGGRD